MRTATPPVIDGKLDEAEWQQAAVIRDLRQIRPGNGVPVSERSEVYFLIDNDALYIGARMWDSDPSAITRSVMKQGASLLDDDRIAIVLDPFNTGRQGYRFETNANGVRNEALYQNNQLQSDWTVIWEARGEVTADGWTAEIAIPFKSLPFDPKVSNWGLNVSRAIRRRGEESVWVSRNRSFNPGIVGQAAGFESLHAGVGLDIVPGLTYRAEKSELNGTSNSEAKPSLEAYYRISPALTGSLTVNTDFSGTEVDDRQVNLTRFNLFFPEKRDFFLNDADVFEFGRIGPASFLANGRSVNRGAQENARPFFSRSLGLSAAGTPVDLLYGGKLSGRVGPFSIGALAIRQDEYQGTTGPRVPAGDAFVARVSANVLAESSVGFIATSGNLKSGVDNRLVGADFLYSNTRFAGNHTLEAEAWAQQSFTEGLDGKSVAYGLGARLPNAAGVRAGVGLREVQKNFFPALGFVNRTDIRAASADVGYTKVVAGRTLQSLYTGVDAQRVTSLSTGKLQSQIVSLRPVELETRARDTVKLVYTSDIEQLTQPFAVYSSGGQTVSIPAGRYRFDDYGVDVATGSQRRVSAKLNLRSGDFYGGTKRNLGGEINWKVWRNLLLKAAHDWNDVDLPQGHFTTRLSRLGTEVYFNTDLTWISLLQYDDVSELFGVHSRVVWIPKAGQEYLLVLNRAWQDFDKDNRFQVANYDVNAKLSYTFRF
ncbi:MAG: carbohydrate binding family 9 domain-containing protein [Vicinamibacterales bacterium]